LYTYHNARAKQSTTRERVGAAAFELKLTFVDVATIMVSWAPSNELKILARLSAPICWYVRTRRAASSAHLLAFCMRCRCQRALLTPFPGTASSTNLLAFCMQVVGQIFVGHLGQDELAAAALGNSFFNMM
jgi:hypothetical protein